LQELEAREAARATQFERRGIRLWGVVLLGVIAVFAYGAITHAMQTPEQRAAAQAAEGAKKEAEEAKRAAAEEARRARADTKEQFILKSVKWAKIGSSIMEATFTFDNRSDFDVKDVEVRCEHAAASGTVIDSNTRTIYETFKAKSQRTIKDFNMGFIHSQAARTGCFVRNLVIEPNRAELAKALKRLGEKREAKTR
jgi:hypothetical protein